VSASSPDAGAAPTPGPLAEEAVRLVEALSDWTRTNLGDLPGAVSSHVGGSAECKLCPFCQALGVLRQTRPETFAHLLEASTALTAALKSVVDSASSGRGTRGGVERIDLDDDYDDHMSFDEAEWPS
jgi:hypothetical protein